MIDWDALAAALKQRDADLADELTTIQSRLDALPGGGNDLAALRQRLDAIVTDLGRLTEGHVAVRTEVGELKEAQDEDNLSLERIDASLRELISDLSVREAHIHQRLDKLTVRVVKLEVGDGPPPPQPKPSERDVPPLPEIDRRVNASMTHAAIIQALQQSRLGIGFEDSADYGALRLPVLPGKRIIGLAENPPTFNGSGTSGPCMAFDSADVHLQNLRIVNWSTGPQEGAIQPNNHLGNGPAKRLVAIALTLEKNGGRGLTLGGEDSIISHCRFLHNRGNQGLGGDLSRGQRILWNYSRGNNPTNRDRHWDAASFFKGAAGRANLMIPVARDIIIRGNYSDGRNEQGVPCGGNNFWIDWDPRDILIELNFAGWGTNAGFLIECAKGTILRNNYAYLTADFYLDPWVRAMNASYGNQNSPETIFAGNLSVPGKGECLHITQQNRSGGSPQGGPGAGIFQSRDVKTRDNVIYKPGTPGRTPTIMYVDRPAVLQQDRSRRGRAEELKPLQDSQATQCRWFFDQYPEGSPWHDGRGSGQDTIAFAVCLEHTTAALQNDLSGVAIIPGEPPTWEEWVKAKGY